MVIAVDVHAEAGFVYSFVVVAGCGVPVAVAGKALTGVAGRSGAPLTLVVHGTTPVAVWAASVVGTFAFWMLKKKIIRRRE